MTTPSTPANPTESSAGLTEATADLVARLHAAVTRCRGRVLVVPADASLSLYRSPSDPARAARRQPSEALVIAHYPPAYAAFVAAHGYLLISLPGARSSFALLPPPAAAQITGATGEHGRAWTEVVADRDAGRGGFAWTVFAAQDISDVHGWAFGPDRQVWLVEDGAPEHVVGTFEAWLAQRVARLETTADEVEADATIAAGMEAAEGDEDDAGEDDEDDEDDEGEDDEDDEDDDDAWPGPSSIDDL